MRSIFLNKGLPVLGNKNVLIKQKKNLQLPQRNSHSFLGVF